MHFDLRQNLNQGRQNDAADRREQDDVQKDKGKEVPNQDNSTKESQMGKGTEDGKDIVGICKRCGKIGHKSEACFKPIQCPRCKKEGHVARACTEILPWECIAPFCGLAAPDLGFHIIQDNEYGEATKELTNTAVITIKEGVVNARQIEGEFKAQAGPTSTWRWFAKKIADNKFQMKFPTAQKVEELSFFTGMEMRTVPGIKFRVDKWDPYVGAKAELQTAWFRIFGIPAERRSEKRVAYVASLVGIPLEVDKQNLKRWDYVRVKIGCRDISKVPATVEGLMDLHFFDFSFQREVLVEGGSTSWNTWTRNADRSNEDNPSPKKARKGEKDNTQQGASTSKTGQINTTSNQGVNYKGKCVGDLGEAGKSGVDNEREDSKGKGDSDEGSEDSGPYFEDLLSPGGENLHFGTWRPTEIQKIARMQINEERSVALNEYGSNLFKYKYDSLAVIEAKFAMTPEKRNGEGYGKDKDGQREAVEDCAVKTVEEELVVVNKSQGMLTQPSPETGTQEAPGVVWSSQEEVGGSMAEGGVDRVTRAEKDTASPNWEEIETVDEIEEGDNEKLSKFVEDDDENKDSAFANQVMEESLTEEDKVNKANKAQVEEAERQTRQSQRIKEQGLEGVKIADKATLVARKKNLEGNHLNLKNSFAVLSNNELIVRAGKMGVETSRIDMEKIELIKDLEVARANMENRMEDNHESAEIENIVPLPLEEMKYIEWKSDSSDEEGFRVVSKKRSRKKIGNQG
jgi:hypothetical protein